MKKSVICIFAIVIYLPCILFLLTKSTGRKMDVDLMGYFDMEQSPEFSFESFLDKTYQESVTSYFNSTFQPRGVFIKTYNTIQYACFDLGNRIIGKDKDIFEEHYILAELCIDEKNDYSLQENQQELMHYVNTLKSVQQKLEDLDKVLFVYITPSKTSYFTENIPDRYLGRYSEDKIRCVDYFKKLMGNTDIPFLDTSSIGNSLEYPTFYKTGIHWSRTFEQEVSHCIINELADLTSNKYRTFKLKGIENSVIPFWRDSDVYDLLNIWYKNKTETYYQYKTEMVIPKEYDNMNFLIQGGSFASGLRYDILGHWPDENIKMIDYNNWMMDSLGNVEKIDGEWERLNLEEWLNDIDCVIVELNESYIYKRSDGFVDYLDNILDTYAS